jgi:hypothetical protein
LWPISKYDGCIDLGGLIKIMSNPRMDSMVAELHVLVFKMLIKHKY